MLRRVLSTHSRPLISRRASSLAQPLAGVPEHGKGAITTGSPQLSALENGVTVISLGRNAPVASIGLYARAGSRFETHQRQGAAFALAALATRSTATQSGLSVSRALETTAPAATVRASRETIEFVGSVAREQAGKLTGLFADMLRPALKEWEVNDARDYLALKAAKANTVAEQTMGLLYAEAFRNVSLGRPLITQSASNVSLEALREHAAENYTSNRVIVVAAGLEHDEAVKAAKEACKDLPAGAEASEASQYVGGNARREAPGDVTHFAIAHSTNGVDPMTVEVLRVLLGSTEGNRQIGGSRRLGKAAEAFESAEAFSAGAGVGGLLGVRGVASAGKSISAVNTAEAVFASLRDISEGDLNGAKQAVIRQIGDNFSCTSRAVPFLASQALQGDVDSESTLSNKVSSLTAADVANAAKQILGTPKTFAAIGDVEGL